MARHEAEDPEESLDGVRSEAARWQKKCIVLLQPQLAQAEKEAEKDREAKRMRKEAEEDAKAEEEAVAGEKAIRVPGSSGERPVGGE